MSPAHTTRLAVKIDGKERIVEINDVGVRVDGQAVDVEVREAEPGVWILRRGAEQTIAQVDGPGGGQGGSTAKLVDELRRPGQDAVVVAAEVSDARRALGAESSVWPSSTVCTVVR